MSKDCEIPADLLLIRSSTSSGVAYIETANIDGETTLKTRESLKVFQNEQHLGSLTGKIEIESPNDNIHEVSGVCTLNEDEFIFGINNIVLRVVA